MKSSTKSSATGSPALGREREGADLRRRRAEEGDGLEEPAVRRATFEPRRLHLFADVRDGLLLARRSRSAPLELIRGEHGDMRAQSCAVDHGEGGLGHGRRLSGNGVVPGGGRRGRVVAGGEEERDEEGEPERTAHESEG